MDAKLIWQTLGDALTGHKIKLQYALKAIEQLVIFKSEEASTDKTS